MTHTDAIIKRIISICADRKITTNRLADLSGLTQSTVDYIISGKTKNPRIKTLIKLANGLNMTVSELLDFKEMNEAIFDDE